MIKHSKISAYKIKKIMKCFCSDLTATQTAEILGMNRNTINRYYGLFRTKIYEYQMAERNQYAGSVELDETYFNRVRDRKAPFPQKKKRGRGTNQQPVFGILERGGRVYTEVVPDCKKATLQKIIRGKISLNSQLITDGWKGYNGLVDVGFDSHLRITKKIGNETKYVRNGVHINGIEAFWSFVKRRLTKFNGTRKNFDLHLKESEWRWNKNSDILFSQLSKIFLV